MHKSRVIPHSSTNTADYCTLMLAHAANSPGPVGRPIAYRYIFQDRGVFCDCASNIYTMDPYDSDSSLDEDFTETSVLLGYAAEEVIEDTISHLGGWPVGALDIQLHTI